MSFDRDQFKADVKDRTDLAEWIRSEGVPLTGGPNEFKACCPFHTEKTPSFTVFRKDGQWGFHCFGCTASGDLFEWIQRRHGLDFPGALKLAANRAGLSLPEPRLYQPREVQAAGAPPVPSRSGFDPARYRKLTPGSAAHTYLTEQRRLPLDLLVKYSVGETADGSAYAFNYQWWPEGAKHPRFEFLKVVRVDRPEGKKIEWRDPKGGKNILFGMLAVPAEATSLVIAEGEIDAVTWAAYGHAAVSVPGGAGYTGWIQLCWDWLQRFKKIYVSFDEDRAGRAKVVEVVQRLGMARTDIVRLPEKLSETDNP